MSVSDWNASGHCIDVDYSQVKRELAEYHPEATEDYPAETTAVEGPTPYVKMRVAGSWNGTAVAVVEDLILIEMTNTFPSYLEATNITMKPQGWSLDSWRIDKETRIIDGQNRVVFKDTITWSKNGVTKYSNWTWIT